MRRPIHLVALVSSLILLLAFAFQSTEVEKLKTDLVGHSMGGREKGWKFQSTSQIKELVINDSTVVADKKVYDITLKLGDPRVPWEYEAKAEVTYEKVDSEWKLQVVGLKALKKIE